MNAHRIFLSPRVSAGHPVPHPEAGQRLAFHRTLPGYRPTALLRQPSLASKLGVAEVYVKDEAVRLGLPAFKMLGASWATVRAIQREWLPDVHLTVDALSAALAAGPARRLAAATDGNHGRGVARMAALLGLQCDVFVPAGTSSSRIDAIRSEGARVTVVSGTYDDTVRRSAQEADDRTLVISDTSWEGYVDTPTDVIQGYATMFEEVDEALTRAGLPAPTHLFLQAGVGAFAAAAISHYEYATPRPIVVVVEPLDADCLLRSAQRGEVTASPGPHSSTMAGLNCGLPSVLAWPTVRAGADAFVAIPDAYAHDAMRVLAQQGVVAGESGAAGLAGASAIARDRGTAQELRLTDRSVVLIINTEGATDPVNYRAQVGEEPEITRRSSPTRRRHQHVVDLSEEAA